MGPKFVLLAALGAALVSCAGRAAAPAPQVSSEQEGSGLDCSRYIDHGASLAMAELDRRIQAEPGLSEEQRERVRQEAQAEAERQFEARRGRAMGECDQKVDRRVYDCVLKAGDLDAFGRCNPPLFQISALPGVDCDKLFDHQVQLAHRYVEAMGAMSAADRKRAHAEVDATAQEKRDGVVDECITSVRKEDYDCLMAASTLDEGRHCQGQED